MIMEDHIYRHVRSVLAIKRGGNCTGERLAERVGFEPTVPSRDNGFRDLKVSKVRVI